LYFYAQQGLLWQVSPDFGAYALSCTNQGPSGADVPLCVRPHFSTLDSQAFIQDPV
jgi:hypothetical protein